MSKLRRRPGALILRAAGALVALLALLALAVTAMAAPPQQTLVSGTITGATAGQAVTLSGGGTNGIGGACSVVSPAAVNIIGAGGAYAILVECDGSAPAQLIVAGVNTCAPFTIVPGVDSVVSCAVAATQLTFAPGETHLYCFVYTGPTTVASTGFASLFATGINAVSVMQFPSGTWLSWFRGFTLAHEITISTGSILCVSGTGATVFN